MDSRFSILSNSIFSEMKKPIVGFRLKLVFDLELKTQNAYVFVDLSSTPTVDTFLSEIARRFKLNQALRLTLHKCVILPDEHILVLANVDEVEVKIRSTSLDHSSDKSGPTENSEAHRLNSECSQVNLQKKSLERKKSDNGAMRACFDSVGQIVPQKGMDICTSVRPVAHRKTRILDADRSLAKFLQQLQEDKKNYDETGRPLVESVSKMEYETEFDNSSFSKHHRSYSQSEVSVTAENDGERNETDQFSGVYDDCVEPKKRKRKRKHAKKKEFEKLEADEVDAIFPEELCSKKVNSKKHIRFREIEEDDEVTCSKNTTHEMDRKIQNFNKKTATQNLIDSPLRAQYSCDKTLSSELSGNLPDDRNVIEPVSNNLCWPKTLKDTSQSPSSSDFFSVPRLRQNNDHVEKELGTILMLKDLKSIGNYNIQFVGRERTSARCGSQSEDEKMKMSSYAGSTNLRRLSENNSVHYQVKSESGPEKIIEKMESIPHETNEAASTMSNHTLVNTPLVPNEKLESSECEVLMQSKIVGDKIFMRTSNIEWKHLTVDSAKNLPPCDKPIEGQSVVFQVLYLKENTVPVLSNLIFGRILKYTSSLDKVVLEIPLAFLEDIFQSCKMEESINLPEGIVHVTGDVFELDWLAVKEPKLLS